MRIKYISIPLLLFLAGCCFPGSAVTRVRVEGQFIDQQGKPLPDKNIILGFPKQYGLAGLDAIWGKPEDYGHRNQTSILTTDNNGYISTIFGPTTYSCSVCIFPPLGTLPKKPPYPAFKMRIGDGPPLEYYVITGNKNGIKAIVLSGFVKGPLDKSIDAPAEVTGELVEETFNNWVGWIIKFKLKYIDNVTK